MVYPVVKYGNPVLETRGEPVAEFGTAELKQLVSDMFETMYAAKGVGLAAPQIGLSQRITVIDVSAGEHEADKIVLINPEVILKEGMQTGEEGCLSLPGFREDVTRAQRVVVRAYDAQGQEFQMEGQDLLARAFLHEIDHLDGILFINHVSALKRDLIRRKIRKLIKAGEWK